MEGDLTVLDDDNRSIFTYDDEDGATPESFSLSALTLEANRLFAPHKCVLSKIAEGGYHKVYDVKTCDGDELGAVARVACAVFPRDKLESEVATMKYIAEKTSVPVPRVISWSSNAANEVGAEFMFISKVSGVTAHSVWKDLPIDLKKNTVRQVAECLFKLWELRFDAMGSLYLADDGKSYVVGPIVETHFYRTIDGVPRTKDPIDLSEFRGPFTTVSSYLSSVLHSELKMYAERREDLVAEAEGVEERVESGRRAMEKALELCKFYPGDRPISNDIKEPISLRLDDFRLSNTMINPETGDLNAFIDFESTSTAPGWLCAVVPFWLRDEKADAADAIAREYKNGETESNGMSSPEIDINYDSPPSEQAILLNEFLSTMRGLDSDGTWSKAYKAGRPYREFAESLAFYIGAWGRFAQGKWVESVLRWLRDHPGVAVPSDVERVYPEIQSSWKVI